MSDWRQASLTSKTDQCGNCRFFSFHKRGNEDMGGGYCRRFPPFFKLEKTLNDGWPNVHHQEWCGEYQRITGKE